MKKTIITLLVLLASLGLVNPSYAEEHASATSATLAPLVVNQQADDRILVLKNYLEKYDSPLAQYADQFVAWADYYRMPWELLPAISAVESTFGKAVPCTNAWGWNVYGDNVHCFTSYPEGIRIITKTLREQYVNAWGDDDIYKIGRHYAASPTWASRVMYFINDIRSYRLAYQQANNILSISL